MVLGLTAALGAALVYGFAAIIQARAVRRLDAGRGGAEPIGAFLWGLLHVPLFYAAVGLTLSGFALHLVAIRTIPLYLAQAGIAASLAVTAVLAVVVLHEVLTTGDKVAVSAITVGLVLLATSSGDIGTDQAPPGLVVGLFVALGAVAGLGVAVVHSGGRYVASLLGFLAGVSFAATGLAARVLPDLTISAVLTSPVAYAVPLSGFLGFALYSLALERGDVTEATGPMIVLQTVTPALVGVWMLDDQVRSGWSAVAVVGFVMTALGAVALARFESGPEGHPEPSSPVPQTDG